MTVAAHAGRGYWRTAADSLSAAAAPAAHAAPSAAVAQAPSSAPPPEAASGALLEEVVYDENGQNRSGSFADYLLATAVEIPPIEVISQHTPSRNTPTGSKGMSEGGVMGAIGALPSAVNDALAPFGIVADRQPLSPMYLRALLRGKQDRTQRDVGAADAR